MARQVHPNTLFHLVPVNQVARDPLDHPGNQHFVSPSSSFDKLGLEVGYHVPSTPKGHVIATLGRNADLILSKSTPQHRMSRVHISVEINPATHILVVCVRSKYPTSVTFASKDQHTDDTTSITGDGVILYGRRYTVSIASYCFEIAWCNAPTASLQALAVRGYEKSLQLLQDVRSRDRPTEYGTSELLSWHITRLGTASRADVEEAKGTRELVGQGAFGTVYKAVDGKTGHHVAIIATGTWLPFSKQQRPLPHRPEANACRPRLSGKREHGSQGCQAR